MAKCKISSRETQALMEQVSALVSQLESNNPDFTGEDLEELIRDLYNSSTNPNKEELFRKVLGFYNLENMDFTPKTQKEITPQLQILTLDAKDFKRIYDRANSAYNYMEQFFKSQMFKYTFLNRDRNASIHLIDSGAKFEAGIINFKNDLIRIIAEGVKLNPVDYSGIFSRKGSDVERYKQLMNSDEVKNFLSTTDLTNGSIENNHALTVHSALYILNNFDSVLEQELQGLVKFDLSKKGTLDNTTYAKNVEGLSTSYWLDDTHEAKNSEHFVSNIAKLIIGTILKVDQNLNPIPGRYMSTADLFMISGLLKQAEYEYNILYPENPICILKDQKKTIRTLLTTSNQLPVFERFRSEIAPLADFLYSKGNPETMSVSEIYQELLNNAKTKNDSQIPVSNILDIEGIFAFELNKNVAPTYLEYDELGNSRTINLSLVYKLSGEIFDNMLSNFQSGIMTGLLPETLKTGLVHVDGFGQKKLYDIATSRDLNFKNQVLNSKDFLDSFKTVFGVELSPGLVDTLGSKIINETANLLNTISTRLQENILSKQTDPEELQALLDVVFRDLQKNSTFSNISQLISLEKDDVPYTTFDNYEGSTIPVFRLNSAMFNDNYHVQNYKPDNPNRSKTNFFVDNLHILSQINDKDVIPGQAINRNRSYVGSTAIKLDVGNKLNSEDASKMSADALFMNDLLGNYVSLYLQRHTMAFQPTEYSDKSSVMMKLINMDAQINHPTLGKVKFSDLDIKGVERLFYYYRKNQMLDLVSNILKTWNEYSGGLVEMLSDEDLSQGMASDNFPTDLIPKITTLWNACNEYVKTLSPKDIENRNRDFLNSGLTPTNIVNELHYSLYNKKPQLNKSIWYNFTKILSPKAFDNWVEEELDSLMGHNIVKRAFLDKTGEGSLWAVLRNIVSQQTGNTKPTLTESAELLKEAFPDAFPNGNFDTRKFLKKYLLLNNFISTQFLDLTTKEPYLDKVKKYIQGDDKFEDSERFKAATKRMVILPGTVENYTLGLLNGVNPLIKVAVVNDPAEETFNITGKTHSQDIFDGSAYINPIYSRLVNNSLPGRGILGTKKPLGMHTGDYYSSLYKYAEFEITNWKMRNSVGGTYDLHQLFKNMCKSPDPDSALDVFDITKNFYGKAFSLKKAANGNRVFYADGLNYYEITQIENTGENQYTIYRSLVNDDGTQVTNNGEIPDVNLHNVEINDVYDIWQALGGYEGMELKDGKLTYSEQNLDVVTNYVNNIGSELNGVINQPLKDSFISMVANSSAVKRGIVNQNSSSEIWEKGRNLLYSKVNTSEFGIQLDANHEADQSELTEMSQTISALASLGNTQEFAKLAYEEIANIIKSNIGKLSTDIKLIDDGRLNIVLQQASKNLVDDLAHEHKISLAESIAYKLQEDLNYVLPFSNANFYNLLSKSILGDLNKSALKRKYPGTGGILNPTSNVLLIYRMNGKTYLGEDIIVQARKRFGKYSQLLQLAISEPITTEHMKGFYMYDEVSKGKLSNSLETVNNNPSDETLLSFLQVLTESIKQGAFDEQVTKDQIRILDNIAYIDNLGNRITKKLTNIEDYINFKKDPNVPVIVGRDVSIPRDLAPQDILWEQNGILKSIWEGDITEMNLFVESVINGDYNIELQQASLQEDGNDLKNLEC